ncbi:MAG: hypothetical protein EOP06_19000, partial [Proteobacteria bacterium]
VKTDIEGYDFTFENKGMVNFSMQSQINLPWGIVNNMNYFFLPKGNWEIYRIEKPIQQFDISFNKNFMDKKLKVGVHCFDVFNSNQVNATIEGRNLRTNFYEKQDSRRSEESYVMPVRYACHRVWMEFARDSFECIRVPDSHPSESRSYRSGVDRPDRGSLAPSI